MNLLEPWILARLCAGFVATWSFAYAAFVGLRVLRHGRLAAATEGRLLLERQAELAATAARVGALVQVLALLLSALAADRLSQALKGAMCGYGVVHANAWGPWAMGLSVVTALGAAVLAGLLRFEGDLPSPLFKAVALASLPVALFASADLVATTTWLTSLDFSVVASCCSTSLDGAAEATGALGASGKGRLPIAIAALVIVGATALASRAASRGAEGPMRARVLSIAGLSALALPFGLAAVILEVSPHVYEAPHHLCVYCLLRLDALALGYPLLGALLLGTAWSLSAGLAAAVAPREPATEAIFEPYARGSLRRASRAFAFFLVLSLLPIVRFTVLSGGRSLFP